MLIDILIPVGIFAGLGILFGVLLAVAAHIFFMKVDSRVEALMEVLPGANCGGCGYSGCAGFAAAVAKGEADPTGCRACKPEDVAKIGEIMGMALTAPVPQRACVMCSGSCHTAVYKYRYEGAPDCIAAHAGGGGDKACPNGCIGLGTCVTACKYDAIHIIDNVAVVDPEKCSGCGACTQICPMRIIAMIPVAGKYSVFCRSVEKGVDTRKMCAVGCIACKICEKNCPVGAITVTDFVAKIDQDKCIGCGKCAEKCPRKIIRPIE